MDFRNIPTMTRRDWFRRDRPIDPPSGPRPRPGLLVNLALYLLAVCIVGLPLAFPAAYLLWLGVDAGLAIAVGCLVAYSASKSGRVAE